MPWVRVDDAFYDHPKWLEAGPLAGWLGMCGLAWCNRNLTDGFIPHAKVATLADFYHCAEIDDQQDPTELYVPAWRVSPYVLASRLVDLGLWEEAEGGYVVHDYLKYQKSAAQIRDIAVKRAESGRKGGLASKGEATDGADDEQTGSKPEANSEAQPQPQPQLPTSDTAGAASGTSKRGTRLPDEFEVTPEMVEWAELKCPTVNWRHHTQRFVNHFKAAPGQRGVKLDWVKTWENWMLKEQGA